mmetsp:Transcript_16485/g.32819  ORF Transcript_16485/g.32819 Transcript_16485/m.32819 type:complete len:285 (+) Transcript_16485:228-1082(+)|eukprot:CAMPEP_0182463382 /NCGR_PEP_ID=MMETSP1319-20130603/7313_1 /TAXON_ID=172717 /ORGANISM="Bolidomonas pacifica, Strain RCC208" /LENGTH=284 /DNA_ID=CAMNT_0024662917 /DNA_START=459 /DNA_END=1313 /DNA_ORIENTATION=+
MSTTPTPPANPPIDPVALSSQFFGFSTSSFCGAVFTAVDDYIADGMDAMEVAMCPSFPDPSQRDALKAANEDFMEAVTSGYDKNLDKFEIYVHRNILSVPEEARERLMSEVQSRAAGTPGSASKRAKKDADSDVADAKQPDADEASDILPSLSSIPTKQESQDLDAELSSLRAQVRASKRRVSALKVGLSRLNASLASASSANTGISDAMKAGEDTIGAPLHDTVSAVVMGKDGLRQLKGEGEKLLASMAAGGEEEEENRQGRGNDGRVGRGDVGGLNEVLGGR